MSTRRKMGRMLVIGGAEDPDGEDLKILPHLVKMAGGKGARVLPEGYGFDLRTKRPLPLGGEEIPATGAEGGA